MTKKQDKVKLEDIIGLVKTDEPTNSVELKKQIYDGYDKSHITRFKLEYDKNAYKCVYDSATDELICNTETIVSMMNDLYRKNCLLEQLKDEAYEEMGALIDENEALKDLNNQELQEYQGKVRDCINNVLILCDSELKKPYAVEGYWFGVQKFLKRIKVELDL